MSSPGDAPDWQKNCTLSARLLLASRKHVIGDATAG